MSGLNGIRGRLAAARVLARRGAVDLRRPDQAVRALLAIRRYGAIGGLVSHTAARYRDAPAITDDYGTVSFGGLEQASNALARGLLAKGVEAGDVIATLQRNSRDVLVTLSAANKIGVRTVLMNTGFAGPQLADVSTREKVSCILADDEFDSILATLPPEILRFTSRRFAELAETQSASSLPAPRQPGGMAILTSGTTGTPKGVPRNRIDPSQSAQLLDRIPWPRDGVYYIAAPLFHATGLATCALGLMLGNHVVMTRRFDPEATLKAIAQHRVGAVVLVPTMLQRILDLGPDVLAKYDTLSLKVLFAAGSALSPDLCRRTYAAFGAVLYNLYGSTEVAVAAVATPDELRRAPGTVGRPPVGCTVAIFDERRRKVTKPRQIGTVFVSSGLSFTGYTDGGNKESVENLLSTGDTGHFDETGLWFIDGRDDDMIVSGGENIFPLEVENLLADHPDILEASVVGVDDAEFGKRLAAYVVSRPESTLDADAVKLHVRAHLARHKIPRDVIFVNQLPRNETGKVLRRQLNGN
ncbi:acyl-CoA synthetase [Mycobacterium parmense]|uniref:Long-chain-fatty-acid--CoA ligase FadD13 n=1 Tax=Mycobacterium parmense TaxID=185642 RepID=A0A7I7Z3C3_9MYCO|nr:acyl-CoA synthetase [Mycobacterium parmense]MCV7352182.1 acyl-CoA synthetase [Mycobacterium parmense]ORW56169.1 acyl-CoA synthetase [Mycobacterium parmense]BBZ48097.1 fatty-acyl-CoA synthase [Mycobacterium parmense]